MIKKAMTIGLVLCSFLFATVGIAFAASPTTLTDDVGDVGIFDDETGQFTEVSGREYLDIKELECSRDYRKVTIKLTVEGEIEDKGDILIYRLFVDPDFFDEYTAGMTEEQAETLLLELASEDWVQYTFDLVTIDNDINEEKSYSIIYINKEILVLDDEASLIDGTSSVSGSTLTVSFNLLSSKENMSLIEGRSDDLSSMGETNYMDFDGIYGELYDPLGSSVNNNGGNGDSDSSGSGMTIFIGLIVILAIVGVAVVIYLVKK